MKNKFYIIGISIMFLSIIIFTLVYHSHIKTTPSMSVVNDEHKNKIFEGDLDDGLLLEKEILDAFSSTKIDFENMSLDEQDRIVQIYEKSKREASEEFEKYIAEEEAEFSKIRVEFDNMSTEEKIDWLMENGSPVHLDLLESIRESEKRIADWNASRSQREAEAEKRRLETEAANKWFEEWKRETRELLKELDLKLRSPRSILLDDNVDTTILADPSESAAENGVSTPQSIVFDPVSSFSKVQSKLEPFLVDLDEKYFDVVVSQTLTSQEINKYFPTDLDREMLRSRTTEFQKSVVLQVRDILDSVKGATAEQKRSLARELMNKNFDKDFAKSILSELEKETE